MRVSRTKKRGNIKGGPLCHNKSMFSGCNLCLNSGLLENSRPEQRPS